MFRKGRKQIRMLSALVFGLSLTLALQSQAEASQYKGPISSLRLNVNPGGTPRVSIQTPSHTSPCSSQVYYAFENANTGIGALWASNLDQALVNNRTVTVVGTGTCDQFGIERVSFIDFF